MEDDTFTCDICGETYEKGWTDEEAEAECREKFGNLKSEQRGIACGDCFQRYFGSERQ
jgi:DNA-directed RNA polymerase subunit RPC12/RpoP